MNFLGVRDWGRYSFLCILAVVLVGVYLCLWIKFDIFALCFFPIYFFGMLYILQEVQYC